MIVVVRLQPMAVHVEHLVVGYLFRDSLFLDALLLNSVLLDALLFGALFLSACIHRGSPVKVYIYLDHLIT